MADLPSLPKWGPSFRLHILPVTSDSRDPRLARRSPADRRRSQRPPCAHRSGSGLTHLGQRVERSDPKRSEMPRRCRERFFLRLGMIAVSDEEKGKKT